MTVLTPPKRQRSQNVSMPCDSFEVIELAAPGLELIWRLLPGEGVAGNQSVSADRNSLFKNNVFKWLRDGFSWFRCRYGVFYTCRMPDYWDIWAWCAVRWALRQNRWDTVITSGGPYSVHWVGWALKKRRLVKRWVMDWRDLWTKNHIFAGLPLVRVLESHIEKTFHALADIVTTVSEPLAVTLRKQTQTPVNVIYNGFDQDDYASLDPTPLFPADGVFRIVYTGTIYSGKQDPTPLFRAVRALHDAGVISPDKLRMVFAGGNCDPSVAADNSGVSAYCEYAGFLPRPDALRMQRDADLLLFLEYESPGVEGVLTGKLFEYLVAGPAIWAVGVGGEHSAGRIIQDHGRGHAFGNDIEALKNALSLMLSNPLLQTCEKILPKSLAIFSRENQAIRLLNLFNQ